MDNRHLTCWQRLCRMVLADGERNHIVETAFLRLKLMRPGVPNVTIEYKACHKKIYFKSWLQVVPFKDYSSPFLPLLHSLREVFFQDPLQCHHHSHFDVLHIFKMHLLDNPLWALNHIVWKLLSTAMFSPYEQACCPSTTVTFSRALNELFHARALYRTAGWSTGPHQRERRVVCSLGLKYIYFSHNQSWIFSATLCMSPHQWWSIHTHTMPAYTFEDLSRLNWNLGKSKNVHTVTFCRVTVSNYLHQKIQFIRHEYIRNQQLIHTKEQSNPVLPSLQICFHAAFKCLKTNESG